VLSLEPHCLQRKWAAPNHTEVPKYEGWAWGREIKRGQPRPKRDTTPSWGNAEVVRTPHSGQSERTANLWGRALGERRPLCCPFLPLPVQRFAGRYPGATSCILINRLVHLRRGWGCFTGLSPRLARTGATCFMSVGLSCAARAGLLAAALRSSIGGSASSYTPVPPPLTTDRHPILWLPLTTRTITANERQWRVVQRDEGGAEQHLGGY
jgi:hypothetical protein